MTNNEAYNVPSILQSGRSSGEGTHTVTNAQRDEMTNNEAYNAIGSMLQRRSEAEAVGEAGGVGREYEMVQLPDPPRL